MRILVTGASGFIGGYVATALARSQNNQIAATGRTYSDKFKNFPNVKYLQLDLTKELPDLSFDVCIHSAGLADDKSSIAQLEQSNVQATTSLLHALKDCKLFIYVSSASVYDFADGKPKREIDSGLNASLSDYGRSKLKGELVVLKSTIPSVYVLRPRAVYGPGDRVLVPRILKLIGKRITVVPGSISARSSMTHIENFCQVIVLCIKLAMPGTRIYNVADVEIYRIKDVFGEIANQKYGHRKFFHVPIPVINLVIAMTGILGIKSVLTRQAVNYLNQDSVLSIDKAMQELGYLPSRNFFDHYHLQS